VTEGGGRYLSLTDVAIRYRTGDGTKALWAPPGCDPLIMREVLPDHRPKLELLGADGALIRSFTTAWRTVDGDDLVAIANRSAVEQQVTCRLRDDRAQVENWDLDTGERAQVPVGDGAFTATFSPYESRLLVLRQQSDVPRRQSISRERAALSTSEGPWPFHALRANAYPLVAAGLEMADPAHPKQWLGTEDGSIPKPFRFAPAVRFRCTIRMDTVASNVRLLFEEGLLEKVEVNGQRIGDQWDRDRYLDPFGCSTDITDLLRPGENTFAGLFQPEIYERWMEGTWYHHENIQPTLDAFVLGDFAVRNDVLGAAPEQMSGEPWERQGFAYYSGSTSYAVTLDLAEKPDGPVWLEADVRQNVLEVLKDGRSLGVRVTHPYLVDVTDVVAPGPNTFELRVTNPVGSLLSAQKQYSWKGKIDLDFQSGLKWAKLVQPLHVETGDA
jgi:hypothetical protein